MKILTINCTNREFSTGQIKTCIEDELEPLGCSFYHCYEYDSEPQKKNGYEFLLSPSWLELHLTYHFTRLAGLQYGTNSLATVRLLHIIKKVHPDIVHIHCPNSLTLNLYRVLNYLKKNKYPTIITNHAEFFFTGNCPHAFECKGYLTGCKNCDDYKKKGNSVFFNRLNEAWNKMKNALTGFDKLCMVAVSPWQLERMRSSVIAGDLDSTCILNGIDTKQFFHYQGQENEWNEKYGNYLLHVTSFFSDNEDDPKGGKYIFKLSEVLEELGYNNKILVVGNNKLSNTTKIPDNIIIIGMVKDKETLAKIYSGAIVSIMTSARETFGMSCAESLCCGTPVVGFKNGGSESIAIGEYSEFVEHGNVEDLIKIIEKWLLKDVDKEEIARVAANKYSNEIMAREYYNLYKEMLG